MYANLLLLLSVVAAQPDFNWTTLRLPPRTCGRHDTVETKVAVSRGGAHLVVASERGIVLAETANPKQLHVVHMPLPALRDVMFLGKNRLLLCTGTQLVQIDFASGAVTRRAVCQISDAAAPLRGEFIVGLVKPNDPAEWELKPAVISAHDGHVVADCSDYYYYRSRYRDLPFPSNNRLVSALAKTIAVDASRTRFVGCSWDLWLADTCTQRTRVIAATASEVSFNSACFSPDGRFVVASFPPCKLLVFDLLDPKRHYVEKCIGTACHIGTFKEHDQRTFCTGMGFIDATWFWFATRSSVRCMRWPQRDVIRTVFAQREQQRKSIMWRASRDGHVLAGIDDGRMLTIGVLREHRRKNARSTATSEARGS